MVAKVIKRAITLFCFFLKNLPAELVVFASAERGWRIVAFFKLAGSIISSGFNLSNAFDCFEYGCIEERRYNFMMITVKELFLFLLYIKKSTWCSMLFPNEFCLKPAMYGSVAILDYFRLFMYKYIPVVHNIKILQSSMVLLLLSLKEHFQILFTFSVHCAFGIDKTTILTYK